MAERAQYRALFISDVHLGTPEAKAERLLAFLDGIEAETIYLVGDIIDGWRLASRYYWPRSHTDVVIELIERAQRCHVIWLPGNHDEFARRFLNETILGIRIDAHREHVAADGKIYLILHGDHVDRVYIRVPWLARTLSWIEGFVNNRLGPNRVTLWARLKTFYRMRRHVAHFEAMILDGLTVDGVICGHIHSPTIRCNGIVYANSGDWVDHLTAIVEHHDGRLEMLRG